jgi:histidine triad (HIT) family protein
MKGCLFCQIVAGELESEIVFEDDHTIAFLDHRPVFPGHSLLIPKVHYEVFSDLPRELVSPFFRNGQLLSVAIERAMEAEGTFVAMNNRISQSVPHVHLHIVPRRRKDGLKGFFWPRHKYESEQAMSTVSEAIRKQVKEEANDRFN